MWVQMARVTKRWPVCATLLVIAALQCTTAWASVVLLDTVSGNTASAGDSFTGTHAPFGLVRVLGDDVDVGRIGVYGELIPNGAQTAANVRWDIFKADGTRVYDSGVVTVTAASGGTWYDSPEASAPIRLAANSDYYVGMITDANFLLRYFLPNAQNVLGIGIVSPGGNFSGSNGVVTNFSDPALTRIDLTVQLGERVFAPELLVPLSIPLPAAAWLFGPGLLLIGTVVRRPRGERDGGVRCARVALVLLAACSTAAAAADGDAAALLAAIKAGDVSRYEQLTRSGAAVDAASHAVVALAAASGSVPLTRRLIDGGADPEGLQDGLTPLMIAARAGNAAMVDLLLEKGVEVDRRDSSGATALYWAIKSGSKAAVERLVAGGAAVDNAITGYSAIAVARGEDQPAILELLQASCRTRCE